MEYLEKAIALDERDEVLYEVRVRRSNSSATGRGIYLREPLDSHRAVTCMVEVRPTVHEVATLASRQQLFMWACSACRSLCIGHELVLFQCGCFVGHLQIVPCACTVCIVACMRRRDKFYAVALLVGGDSAVE